MKGVQTRGINDVPDFLAETLGHPVKADFQSLEHGLLPGKNTPPLLTFLPTLR